MSEEDKPERIRRKRHSLLARFRIAHRIRAATRIPPRSGAFGRFQAGTSGALPAAGPEGVVLAACNDYYYRRFAISLAASLERQGVPQKLHLHLCAPDPETLRHVEALAAALRSVALTWTADDCRLAEGLSHRTIYFAASRFLVAPLVLEATGAPLLCIDVDGIVSRPVWPAFAPAAQGADVALVRRPKQRKPTMKILASAVGFEPTPLGLRFAADLGRSLAEILGLRPRYHVDQIAIHYLLEREPYRSDLRIAAMPKSLWDHDFAEGSAIWTAKGWSRKDSDVFRAVKQEADASLPEALRPAAE